MSAQDLIGEPRYYVTRASDTLLDIARDAGVGFVALRAANPGVDPWLPGLRRIIALPLQHILPAGPRRGIIINLPEQRLYYFPPHGESPMSFAISIGDEGRETPLGLTRIARKTVHPAWTPTAAARAENPELPARVPPGPGNPMGDFALYLAWPSYAIHGTNKPYSIGRRGSHGCIRLYPEDIARLYARVAVGTPVRVVEQRAKVGWLDQRLYLEVHPAQGDANAIEANGRRADSAPFDARSLVHAAAGEQRHRIDWAAVLAAGAAQTGMPVAVMAPPGAGLDSRQ